MSLAVGDEVDLVLPLLLLKPVLAAPVLADAAAAEDDDDRPDEPEPPELIVVTTAVRLPTAVSKLTDVASIVHSRAQ